MMNLKNIYRFATVAIIISLAQFLMTGGCRGTFERPDESRPEEKRDTGDSSFDPMGLPSDSDIIPEKYPLLTMADTAANAKDTLNDVSSKTVDSLLEYYETYRIQLYSSNTYGPASREMGIAREVFDQAVHLDYEVPYYKVRVGDFADRKEAEEYLPAAIEAGYSNAWIVKVTINVQEVEKSYDEDIPPLIDSLEVYPDNRESEDEQSQYPEDQ